MPFERNIKEEITKRWKCNFIAAVYEIAETNAV